MPHGEAARAKGRGRRARRSRGVKGAGAFSGAPSLAGAAEVESLPLNQSAVPSEEEIDAALTLKQLRAYEKAILWAKGDLEESLEDVMLKYRRVRAKMYRDHKLAVIAEDNSALKRFQAGCPKPKEVWQSSKAELDKQAACLQQQSQEIDESDLGLLMRKHLFEEPVKIPSAECVAFRQIGLDQLRPAERACLSAVGDARWTADGLVDANSSAVAASLANGGCGRHWMGTAEARCLLSNKNLLFIGNSVVRRQLYTVLDLVAGPRAHRQLTNFTDVKLPEFADKRAISTSWIWDQDNLTRSYHGAQLFTVDLTTGDHRFHMPHKELCGLTDSFSVFNPGRMRQLREPVRSRWHREKVAYQGCLPSHEVASSGV